MGEHLEFVNERYDDGTFVAFGPRVPSIGGVILAGGNDEEKVKALMDNDPFVREGIAEYEFIQCVLSRAVHPGLSDS